MSRSIALCSVLACSVSAEKSGISMLWISLMTWHLSFTNNLCLNFERLTIMCHSDNVYFNVLPVFRCLYLSPQFGNLLSFHIINLLSHSFFPCISRNIYNLYIKSLAGIPQILKNVFTLSNFSFLARLIHIIYYYFLLLRLSILFLFAFLNKSFLIVFFFSFLSLLLACLVFLSLLTPYNICIFLEFLDFLFWSHIHSLILFNNTRIFLNLFSGILSYPFFIV